MTDKKKKVLILCTGNSARSQMAEGILRHLAGDRFDVESAGVAPSSVREEAIAAMNEIDIDISSHHSKSVERFVGQEFDFIITVCDNAKESCPIFPGSAERIHWGFEDPAAVEGSFEVRLQAIRNARDLIEARIREFISS